MSGNFVNSPYGSRPSPSPHPYHQQDALGPSPRYPPDDIFRTSPRPSHAMDPRFEDDMMPSPHPMHGRSSRVGPHPDYHQRYHDDSGRENQCCLCPKFMRGNQHAAHEPGRFAGDGRLSRYDGYGGPGPGGVVLEAPRPHGMGTLGVPERPMRHSTLTPPHPEYAVSPRRSKSDVVAPYPFHGPPSPEYRGPPAAFTGPVGYDGGIAEPRNAVWKMTDYQRPMADHLGSAHRNPNAPAPGEWRA